MRRNARINSAQHCIIAMSDHWKIRLVSNGVCGTILTDLSKGYDHMAF